MINKSITENNKKRPIIGRLICRNNQKQIPLASESKNEMEKGTILIVDDNKGVLASLELLLETEFSEIKTAHHPNQIMSIFQYDKTKRHETIFPVIIVIAGHFCGRFVFG